MQQEIQDFINNIKVEEQADRVFTPAEINEELYDGEKALEDVLAACEKLAEEGKIARAEGKTEDGYKGQLFTKK
ncbi:hypothetical protein [Salibacterium halotolerans]|uniref:Uncharacterized protein n=1 Tax=Salibacterium halotolerans TaxID=1884432 RepID=A0A1I5TEZ3_9BACI|nr:hypothetical protein [Salibacterium halotolerans]SFP81635.1 hypothetical protein SAMN05518683_110136 [Salibacterium halotolerans]